MSLSWNTYRGTKGTPRGPRPPCWKKMVAFRISTFLIYESDSRYYLEIYLWGREGWCTSNIWSNTQPAAIFDENGCRASLKTLFCQSKRFSKKLRHIERAHKGTQGRTSGSTAAMLEKMA